MTRLLQLSLICLFFVISTDSATIPSVSCLDDCICEQDERNPLIRCESGERIELEIPTKPMSGYEIIALPCNNIVNLPSVNILKLAFPDLKAIDVEGNLNFNCSQLSQYSREFAVNSDCGKEVKFDCKTIEKDCDWKCASLDKIKKLWKKFKETISRKAKEWGADEAFQNVQDWLHNAYKKFAST